MKKAIQQIIFGMLFLSYGMLSCILLCVPMGMLFNTGCFGAKHTLLEWFFGIFFMLLTAASQKICFIYFIKKLV
jgi:hypothetical protein